MELLTWTGKSTRCLIPGAVHRICQVMTMGLAFGMWGCSETLLVEQADLSEKADADAFWHDHLANEAMVTTAEAYRAVLLLADGEEKYTDFDAREAALVERGMVRPAWGLKREAAIDRGSVAFMVCKAMELRGGINYTLLGGLGIGDRRYAVRELVDRRLMRDTTSHHFITGGEMLDLLLEADRYMAHRGLYKAPETGVPEILESDEQPDPRKRCPPTWINSILEGRRH